ncbi:uncharacterized protein LOC107883902 [Acyrthosiphon pisum]|uniref:Reverse transcriptase domain-containing protein n=1 Tax=Acyrthosiphon pisum TaxID=7029 RepID=A0A8R2H854_ACYPI|nr:uncharacterized protein LOC107883902 [Acyrthosiphon pisum]|eukprot:XP_016660327.1 PREDICTED: uncharacterized protein LOC107883902 [Acyrthosiphon pisum]
MDTKSTDFTLQDLANSVKFMSEEFDDFNGTVNKLLEEMKEIPHLTKPGMKNAIIANCKQNKTLNLSNINPEWSNDKHLYINQHLTKNKRQLHGKARATAKEKGYKYVWINQDAEILIRKDEKAKIFERVIKLRLANYLEENEILTPSQFGFRKGLNTEGAINSLMQSIHHALDSKKKVIGIIMNLSKAFDSVCHKHRTHKVQIDNVISSCKTMSLGVPQGTVLSPLLYTIYVTGLSNLQIDGSLYSYADDTALLISDNTWDSRLSPIKTRNLTLVLGEAI